MDIAYAAGFEDSHHFEPDAGATYPFQVRALGRLGYTDWSDPITFICS